MRPVILILIICILFPLTGFGTGTDGGGGNIVIIKPGSSAILQAAASNAAAYQWYKNGVPLNLAIEKQLVISEPGSYTVVAFNSESCPSQLSDAIVAKFSADITPDLWVTVQDNSRLYGAANPTFSFTFKGFIDGDDQRSLTGKITGVTNATSSSAVGKYTVSAGGVTSHKYNIHFASGNLTVTQAPLIVTANDDTKNKDGQPYKPANGVTFNGFMNNDTADSLRGSLTYAGNALAATDAGVYQIIPAGYSSDNYDIHYVAGKLTITDQTVDVSVVTYAETRSVGVGETFTYFISANNKNTKAGKVQVKDVLPQNIDFVRISNYSAGNATYDRGNNTLTWLIGDLAANSKAQLELQVRAVKPGSLKNSAVISSAERDSYMADNTSADFKEINSLKIPNIFTPNADGVNDAFVIPSLENYPDNEITVFNRAGSVVYQKKSYQNDWDGSTLGDGTYFYILKVKIDGDKADVYKGYVTLLRTNVNHLN